MDARTLRGVVTVLATVGFACRVGGDSVDTEETEESADTAPVIVPNRTPEILTLSVAPTALARGGTALAVVSATDADEDALTVTWSATGAFTVEADPLDPARAVVTAPGTDAQGAVTVQVTDPSDARASASVAVATTANRAPRIASLVAAPPLVAPAGTIALSATAADDDGDPLTYAWTAPAAFTLSGEGAVVSLIAPATPATGGIARVVVDDGQGGTATAEVFVATRPADATTGPTITALTASPPVVARGGTVALAVTVNDPAGDGVDLAWTAPSGWTLSSTTDAAPTLTAPATPGASGVVTVRVTDDAGETTDGAVVVATRANVAPAIGSLTASPGTVAPGGAVSIVATATDADDTALTYAWTVPQGWTRTGTGAAITLTAPATHEARGLVSLEVTDGHGGAARASVPVETAPDLDPVIVDLSASPATVLRGGTIALIGSATDPEGRALTWSWTASQGWTLTNAATDAPTLQAPATPGVAGTVTATVTDPGGHTASRTLSVATLANRAPTVDLFTARDTVAPLSSTDLDAEATDPDGDDVTWTWTATAWTLTPDAADASVTAPDAYDALTTVTATATDPFGGVGSARVTLRTVSNVPPVLSGVVADPTVVDPGGTIAVEAFASDVTPLDVLDWQWTAPAGWTLTPGAPGLATLIAPDALDQHGVVRVSVTDRSGGTAHGGVAVATKTSVPPPQIALVDGSRQWDDGTFAASCAAYRHPTGGQVFEGPDATSGTYSINPLDTTPFRVWCDMDFDGGGWTKVMSYGPSNGTDMGTATRVNLNGAWTTSARGTANGKVSAAEWDALWSNTEFMMRVEAPSDGKFIGNGAGYLKWTTSSAFTDWGTGSRPTNYALACDRTGDGVVDQTLTFTTGPSTCNFGTYWLWDHYPGTQCFGTTSTYMQTNIHFCGTTQAQSDGSVTGVHHIYVRG